MFDRVVLCKQGSTGENAVLPKIRNRTLDLGDGTVKVLLLEGNAKPTAGLNDFNVTSSSGTITGVSDGSNSYTYQELPSFFSCLSELHVVARGRASNNKAGDPLNWTPSSGHAVLVVVNSQATVLAVSDELITSNEKLFMTFDIEETNNVLQAKADFDGIITQGILEERLKKIDTDFDLGTAAHKDYSDSVLEENGGGKLPTNDAVKSYVSAEIGTGTLTITKHNSDLSQDPLSVSFSANEADNSTKTVTFGNAADKDFATSIGASADNDKLPTNSAVDAFVGKGVLTVTVGGAEMKTFGANQSSSDTLALGSAAVATVASSVNVTDAPNQAMLPTNEAVNNFVGKGTLRIVKGGTNNTGTETTSASFGANQSGDTTFNLGLGDAADKTVDTSISGNNTSLTNSVNLPTSAAVASYVNAQIGKANLTLSVAGQNDVVFNANETTDKSLSLGNAASHTVDTSIDAPTVANNTVTLTDSSNLPTSAAVASYVDAQLGVGDLTITKNRVGQSAEVVSFSANEADSSHKTIEFGTASDSDVCTNIHQEQEQNTTSELNAEQEASLVTLAQARQIADESTSNSKSLTPTAAGSNEDIVIEKGAMVWLAVHFIGEVGITDFTTSNDYLAGGHAGETPTWSGTASTGTDAYIAKLNDNAGDFYATTKKIAAGHTFRTLNAMDVSGMSDPSYGFALCLCLASPSASASNSNESNPQGGDATNNGGTEGGNS